STRPKSKILELKLFEPSSSSKPSPNLDLKNRSKFSKICAAKDHSINLVGIAVQLGDLPFCLVHCHITLAFIIIMFWIIRRHSTTSQNCSTTRRLLFFTTNLCLSFRAQHTGTKGENKTFWRLAEWVWQFSDLHFFVFSAAFVPFC
ncbi:hypothetical protein H5410_050665, partial [Solanum commersonii]